MAPKASLDFCSVAPIINPAMRNRDVALKRAIRIAGGNQRLAEAIGCSPQAISLWDKVPHLRVLAIERATGVPRSELRPDLYPPAE